MTEFVAHHTIQVFKWKLGYWRTFIHHCELDIYSVIKDLLNEIHDDINKLSFWCCIWNMSTFRRAVLLSESG